MIPDLAVLIELQHTMSHFETLRERAEALPPRIESCQTEHQQILDRHDEVVASLKQLQVDLHDAEVDLQEGEQAIAKRQTKLHEVKTNVEYKAVLHEIETLKKKNSEAETRILELMDAVEEAKVAVAESEKQLKRDKAEFGETLNALEQELAEVNEEIENYGSVIETKRSEMKPRIQETFDRIYNHNGGKALAAVNNGYCGYCQINLAAHRIQVAKAGRDLITCDHCGCILYWKDEDEEVPA